MSSAQTAAKRQWSLARAAALVNFVLALIGIAVFLSGIVPINHFLTAPNHPTVFYSELSLLTIILILSGVSAAKK